MPKTTEHQADRRHPQHGERQRREQQTLPADDLAEMRHREGAEQAPDGVLEQGARRGGERQRPVAGRLLGRARHRPVTGLARHRRRERHHGHERRDDRGRQHRPDGKLTQRRLHRVRPAAGTRLILGVAGPPQLTRDG
ncbi:MAG TPA: hypothetical protein VFU36_15870 [Jatrophihabitans sp.]|nr:hypothetical protein [Jatrophihabitans sp.]